MVKSVVILGACNAGHCIPLIPLVSGLASRQWEVTVFIENHPAAVSLFKSKYSSFANVEIVLYPSVPPNKYSLVDWNGLFLGEAGYQILFNINYGLSNHHLQHVTTHLSNLPTKPALIIADTYALWAAPLAKSMNVKLISSHTTFLSAPNFLPTQSDMGPFSHAILKQFNEDFDCDLANIFCPISPGISCCQQQIVYHSEMIQPSLPENWQATTIFLKPPTFTEAPIRSVKVADPTIYVSVGSISFREGIALVEKILELAKLMPSFSFTISACKLKSVSQKLASVSVPVNVAVVEWIDQSEFLLSPNVLLFIFHGGFGGFRDAIQAEIPTVVCPMFADQGLVARTVSSLHIGVGLQPNPSFDHIRTAVEEIFAYYETYLACLTVVKRSFSKNQAVDQVIQSWEQQTPSQA